MTVIIDYATISPSVLATRIEHEVPCAVCRFSDFDEDYFEFSVEGWSPLSLPDLVKVTNILSPYV